MAKLVQMNLFGKNIEAVEKSELPINIQPVVEKDAILEQKRKEFEQEVHEVKPKVIPKVELTDEQKYPNEYCFNQIKNSRYVWDMRVWNKYKDIEEVRDWVKNYARIHNLGHVNFCIDLLRERGVDDELIVQAVMANEHKVYAKRLVRCMANPDDCPRYREAGNFSDANCQKCDDKF